MVRNGDLLATKRHKVHKKFESSSQQIIRFVAFVIFVARKNGEVREGARSNSVGFSFASVTYRQSLLRCRRLFWKWLAFVWEEFVEHRCFVWSEVCNTINCAWFCMIHSFC